VKGDLPGLDLDPKDIEGGLQKPVFPPGLETVS
jgi:hypothetical protein